MFTCSLCFVLFFRAIEHQFDKAFNPPQAKKRKATKETARRNLSWIPEPTEEDLVDWDDMGDGTPFDPNRPSTSTGGLTGGPTMQTRSSAKPLKKIGEPKLAKAESSS